MSTLSLRKIKHDSSSVDNITLDSSGNVGINKTTPRATSGFNSLSLNGTDGSEIWFDAGNTAATRLSGTASETRITAQASGSVITMFTGATERLRVDNSGRVTMPYQVSFSAGFSTSYTQLSGVREVQFNYKNFDVGTNFNTSTYRFTAPVAGKYLMSAFIGSNGSAPANAYFGIAFSVNGVNAGLCWSIIASGYQKDAITQLLNLNANDFVSITMEVQNNTTLAVGNFSGHLIG